MVSAIIMKSYCLCSSDPSKINKLYVAVTFTVGFLSALLTPFLCIYEKVAKLGCYFGRCMSYVSGVANL